MIVYGPLELVTEVDDEESMVTPGAIITFEEVPAPGPAAVEEDDDDDDDDDESEDEEDVELEEDVDI